MGTGRSATFGVSVTVAGITTGTGTAGAASTFLNVNVCGATSWLPDGSGVEYALNGKFYRYDFATRQKTEIPALTRPAAGNGVGGRRRGGGGQQGFLERGRQASEAVSPDGKFKATFKDANLWIAGADGSDLHAVTTDGSKLYFTPPAGYAGVVTLSYTATDGNGAAMRVAPLGAYFADDLDLVVNQARLSAEITHAHPEGIAGAIAVAVAAAIAWRSKIATERPTRRSFIEQILPFIPESEVLSRTIRARDIAESWSSFDGVVALLGNGIQISAPDTVPFCLWCAGECLENYSEALWLTARALGDVDTNCAIFGGIVANYTGIDGIPEQWRNNREALPAWLFED